MDAPTQQPTQPGVNQQPVQPAQAQPVYYVAGYAPDPTQVHVQPAQMAIPAAVPAAQSTSFPILGVSDWQFWKGALLGAAVTLLITNESVQKGTMKMISKVSAAAQSGVEEIKEKFEDAKAEAEAEVGK